MSTVQRARVLIADDHALVAEALKRFLVPDFDVVAVAGDGRALLALARSLEPEVIVADIGLPLLNGLDASERIKRFLPNTKLVFITMNAESDIVAEAFRRGASGYVLKTSAATELVKAIHQALKGHSYVPPALSDHSSHPRTFQAPTRERLTERQLEVLQLLAEGHSMKEAAALLNLTARTVAFHKYRIMESLRLESDAEIVRYAVQQHIVFT